MNDGNFQWNQIKQETEMNMDHSNHHHGSEANDETEMLKDPICGMTVTRERAVAVIEHNGVTYGFCSEHCRKTFQSDPDKYSSSN